jgi:hypothetical protein
MIHDRLLLVAGARGDALDPSLVGLRNKDESFRNTDVGFICAPIGSSIIRVRKRFRIGKCRLSLGKAQSEQSDKKCRQESWFKDNYDLLKQDCTTTSIIVQAETHCEERKGRIPFFERPE